MIHPDPYPSRCGGDTRWLQRHDPVVHGDASSRDLGPLPGATLLDYERRGFLCFDSLLSPEDLSSLATQAARLFHERRSDPSPKVVREPDRDEVRSIFGVHEDEETFRALVHLPVLLDLAEQILGGPVYVHQSRINYKPAFHGQPFHWHSDFETWHAEDGMPRMRAFSLSISLTENRSDNGPLMLIPGSHRRYLVCPDITPEAHYERSLRRQEAGVPSEEALRELVRANGIESPKGPPGSATLFDCNLIHGSNGNITPFPRTNVFLVFNSVDNALRAPFSGQPPRPVHVANRDAVPLR